MIKLVVLICSYFLFVFSTAKGYNDFDTAPITKNLNRVSNVVIKNDSTTFIVHDKGSGTLYRQFTVTVLNEDGIEDGALKVYYDFFQTVRNITGFLYDTDGNEVKRLEYNDIRDVNAYETDFPSAGNNMKYAILSHDKYPYTVEYYYEVEFDGLMFYPDWYPQKKRSIPIQNASLTVNLPPKFKLRYKSFNLDIEPIISKNQYKKTYYWKVNNLPTYKSEIFSPKRNFPVIYLAPNEFEMEGFEGNMKSWKSLGKFLASLNKGRNDLSETTIKDVKDLVAYAESDEEKVRKIYWYLQESTFYLNFDNMGMAKWQPSKVSEVESNQFGDCKALSFYTKCLLESVGIEANYTVVRAGNKLTPMQPNFPSQSHFNHVILRVPLKRKTIWLECSNQKEIFGYLSDFTSNRNALVLTDKGGKVMKTIKYDKEHNIQKKIANITIDTTGNLKVEYTATYSALCEDDKVEIARTFKARQKNLLYDNLKLPKFIIKEWEVKRETNIIPKTTEKITLQIKKYAKIEGNRLIFKPNLLTVWRRIIPEYKSRKFPVELPSHLDFLETDEITWNLPKGYYPEVLLENTNFKSLFGEYVVSQEMNEKNQLIYKRKFSANAGKFKAENYSELRKFWDKIRESDKNEVVFLNKN